MPGHIDGCGGIGQAADSVLLVEVGAKRNAWQGRAGGPGIGGV